MKLKFIFCFIVIFFAISKLSFADSKKIYVLDIKKEIGPSAWRQTKDAIAEAKEFKADYFFIRMNTYGGLVVDADSIRSAILDFQTPVFVYINKNAASAGALISIACDSIYMSDGANIGAATVVNQSGQAMPDKYQSYMRSTMRSTAESHSMDTIITKKDTIIRWRRDPKIAEAMVDESVYIKGLIDSTKVLTFTTDEAIKYNYCEGKYSNFESLLKALKLHESEMKIYKPTTVEKLIDIMINPVLQGILIMFIIGGLYFELQTPGIGFAIAVSFISALLYFSPLYIEGLAENWEIIIFILGVILIGVELFVIPGFGVAGISGIILIIGGLSLSMIDNVDFNFSTKNIKDLMSSMLIVLLALISAIVGGILLTKKLLAKNSILGNFALHTVVEGSTLSEKEQENEANSLIGKIAIAKTVLRPSGKILVDTEIYDAVSLYGYIEKSKQIRIVKIENQQCFVELYEK